MNALPMVSACALRQWHGLPEVERAHLLEGGDLPIYIRHAAARMVPIWQVIPRTGGQLLTLLSVKRDVAL